MHRRAVTLLLFLPLPALAQDGAVTGHAASMEAWLVEKPILGKGAYKGPNRTIWRLADLKKMHAGQNNWSQQVVLDYEQSATYNSAAPGSQIVPRMHPDTPTAFVVMAGQMRFTVEGQEPVVAGRGSIINILKSTVYSYEVLGAENALWIEDEVRGYSSVYPVDGPKPVAKAGNEIAKVTFVHKPARYAKPNQLYFNTLDAIANCAIGPAVQDDRLYLTPNVGFVNPADDKCSKRGGGNAEEVPENSAAFNDKLPFGHLHSGAVEWWIVQLGEIDGKFEDHGEFHAVEGDVVYAPPGTWHLMTPEALSGPSVRLTMGSYQRIVMQNTGPMERMR